MTTQNQIETPATVFDIDAPLKQHVEPLNIKTSEHVAEYLAAKGETRNALENKQRFEKAGAASRVAADAINLEIRATLRQGEVSSKEAHKKRSERAGHLEDVEIYESMAREAEVSIAAANLLASRHASEIVNLRRQARQSVQLKLAELIFAKLMDEFRAIAIFINLTAEIASNGDSDEYNARGDVFDPMDFAIRDLAKIFHAKFKERSTDLSSTVFLAEIPDGIGNSVLSPLEQKRIKDQIAAMEATL